MHTRTHAHTHAHTHTCTQPHTKPDLAVDLAVVEENTRRISEASKAEEREAAAKHKTEATTRLTII